MADSDGNSVRLAPIYHSLTTNRHSFSRISSPIIAATDTGLSSTTRTQGAAPAGTAALLAAFRLRTRFATMTRRRVMCARASLGRLTAWCLTMGRWCARRCRHLQQVRSRAAAQRNETLSHVTFFFRQALAQWWYAHRRGRHLFHWQ